jgi:hypothetical protein
VQSLTALLPLRNIYRLEHEPICFFGNFQGLLCWEGEGGSLRFAHEIKQSHRRGWKGDGRDGRQYPKPTKRDSACPTDKVKPILRTGSLSTTGSRRCSGLIAITRGYYMPIVDEVPRAYRNETQLSEQEAPTVAAIARTRSELCFLSDAL